MINRMILWFMYLKWYTNWFIGDMVYPLWI